MTTLSELPKSYAPAAAEPEVRARWNESGVFHVEPGSGEPYSILIPPPNVTAGLHLGHALNNTLQDVLIRFHRMRGHTTMWMPGTDHAGIATQTVVEKRLLTEEGKRRTDFSRDDFVARVQSWKDQYESTITEQLQAMGCSCDWPRQRFTMDDMCATAVREAFFLLFREDLIYRGKRLVNWDPVTLTALADDEVEMQDVQGHMWYLQYPLVEPVTYGGRPIDHITVATTRPETMLGDTAIGMNPDDPRAKALAGAKVRVPIVDRVVPIILDDYVVLPRDMGGDPTDAKSEIATGFLKVTPAHDPNDWDLGVRHDLPVINVMAPDGSISDAHGWEDATDEARAFIGMSREDARSAIVAWFESKGALESVRDYSHSVGHSYRSHVPIEPYLSDQWYVRVSDDRLVGEAQRALDPEQRTMTPPPRSDGRGDGDDGLTFYPDGRYARVFESWHAGLRDWCISRQLWWGHRIPVWSQPEGVSTSDDLRRALDTWRDDGRVAVHDEGDRTFVCVRRDDDPDAVSVLEAGGFERDPDVLDTWFSSALWPLSTMGWPDPGAFPETEGLLEFFHPTSVLCTGRDIITLWVSRMVMFTRYFRGPLPFHHVYINPMIQDGHGQRMSKSLGNGVDPRDIIESHGADAMRFALVQLATSTQDVRIPVECLCADCGKSFPPKEITSPAGYLVAAPEQPCPHCGHTMVTQYGVTTGTVKTEAGKPIAKNSSSRFDNGRSFATKLWNAGRLTLGKLNSTSAGTDVAPESAVDRWMVSRVHRALHQIEDAMAVYHFNTVADTLYNLVRRDFCDWYLEAIKPTIDSDPVQQQVLRTVFDAILRLLHPICPFVTETLWPHLQATGAAGLDGIELPPSAMLATAAWPDIACRVDDADAVDTVERAQTLTNTIRNMRGENNVNPKKRIVLHATSEVATLVDRTGTIVPTLAGLASVATIDDRPADAIPLTFEGTQVFVSGLVDAVDVDAERARLGKRIGELQKAIGGFRGKLGNPGYVNKAPEKLVDETRQKLAQAEADLDAARASLAALEGSG